MLSDSDFLSNQVRATIASLGGRADLSEGEVQKLLERVNTGPASSGLSAARIADLEEELDDALDDLSLKEVNFETHFSSLPSEERELLKRIVRGRAPKRYTDILPRLEGEDLAAALEDLDLHLEMGPRSDLKPWEAPNMVIRAMSERGRLSAYPLPPVDPSDVESVGRSIADDRKEYVLRALASMDDKFIASSLAHACWIDYRQIPQGGRLPDNVTAKRLWSMEEHERLAANIAKCPETLAFIPSQTGLCRPVLMLEALLKEAESGATLSVRVASEIADSLQSRLAVARGEQHNLNKIVPRDKYGLEEPKPPKKSGVVVIEEFNSFLSASKYDLVQKGYLHLVNKREMVIQKVQAEARSKSTTAANTRNQLPGITDAVWEKITETIHNVVSRRSTGAGSKITVTQKFLQDLSQKLEAPNGEHEVYRLLNTFEFPVLSEILEVSTAGDWTKTGAIYQMMKDRGHTGGKFNTPEMDTSGGIGSSSSVYVPTPQDPLAQFETSYYAKNEPTPAAPSTGVLDLLAGDFGPVASHAPQASSSDDPLASFAANQGLPNFYPAPIFRGIGWEDKVDNVVRSLPPSSGKPIVDAYMSKKQSFLHVNGDSERKLQVIMALTSSFGTHHKDELERAMSIVFNT